MIIEQCRKKSIELLVNNSTKFGVLASSKSKRATKRNYLSIFGRDASICSLGMVASGEKKLILSAKRSLLTLAKYQAKNGQISNYVKPELDLVDFWYVGCIDSTLWWLLAIKFYDKYSGEKQKLEVRLRTKIVKALDWLECQEHQNFYLLQQNEASDWADIMPRSGFVLYTNTLWYWVKNYYELPNTKLTKNYFNALFLPSEKTISKKIKETSHFNKLISFGESEKNDCFYLSFVNYSFWGDDADVYGNILAILFGLANKETADIIISGLLKRKANKPFPAKTCLNPVKANSKLWREYMKTFNQNKPYQYHNGGIWPFIGGFWVLLLAKKRKKALAQAELENLADVNKRNNWQFNEWFHGKTGKPMGMTGQSWNAGTFLLAYHYLKGDIKI